MSIIALYFLLMLLRVCVCVSCVCVYNSGDVWEAEVLPSIKRVVLCTLQAAAKVITSRPVCCLLFAPIAAFVSEHSSFCLRLV